MSAQVTVTGNLGQDPTLRHSQAGKPICDLSIGCTHSERNRDTNQWSEVGESLWLRAAFFDQEAERLAASLAKGDRVTVTGTLIRRQYDKRDGGTGESLELRFPRFLGVIPRKNASPSGSAASYAQPANDPWGQPAASDPGVAPF